MPALITQIAKSGKKKATSSTNVEKGEDREGGETGKLTAVGEVRSRNLR